MAAPRIPYIDYLKDWPQMWALFLMVLGFVLAISVSNQYINYAVVGVAGIMAGRMVFRNQRHNPDIYYVIIIGFIIGYMLGSVHASRRIVLFTFIIATVASYYIHRKRYIT